MPAGNPVRAYLRRETAEIQLSRLSIGTDNIHHDVYLSARFVDQAQRFVRDLVWQTSNVSQFLGAGRSAGRSPETAAFKKVLSDLAQASLERAQFEKNIELDLLLRISLLKFLTAEISAQIADLLLQCKESIRSRGDYFERGEQAHILRSRLAELTADRRNIYRQAGQQIHLLLAELDDSLLAKSRKALFGDDFAPVYAILRNRLMFVEGGRDDQLMLDHYVLLGNYMRDADRFETLEGILLDILRERVLAEPQGAEMAEAQAAYQQLTARAVEIRGELARLDEERDARLARLERGQGFLSRLTGGNDPTRHAAALEQIERRRTALERELEELGPRLESAQRRAEYLSETYLSQLGDYLNEPENARRLFDPDRDAAPEGGSPEARRRLLEEWMGRLRERDLWPHILASYEVKNIYREYCPPIHLQQLRRALVSSKEMDRVEEILNQFPARKFSMKRLEDSARLLRRYPREQEAALAIRLAEDLMRLRRDQSNYRRLVALVERVRLLPGERERELSRLNNTLYEYLLPDEERPQEDRVLTHTVIKADVRSSSKITQDLLARGLNPAAHFSRHLHEPVQSLLERYGAAKVFIEGDAIILAVYETERNRVHARAVARTCVLARKITEVSAAYNQRAESSNLPRLEIGLGIAFQPSPPTYWMDGESRIMISRALNLSDRLSSCSKVARRILGPVSSPFRVFLFQTALAGAEEEELEELLVRFNLNGVELNEEGFQKLSQEVALRRVEKDVTMPWGVERAAFYLGELAMGEQFEPIIIRQGVARMLDADGKIGQPGPHQYYEVCSDAQITALLKEHLTNAAPSPPAEQK